MTSVVKQLKIRNFEGGDREQLQNLYQTVKATLTPDEVHDFNQDTIGEDIFVADYDRQIIGFIAIWPPDRFIHHLYILPTYQGQGVGSQLLFEILKQYQQPLSLKCLVNNPRAVAFYQQHGFQIETRGMSEDGAYYLLQSIPKKE